MTRLWRIFLLSTVVVVPSFHTFAAEQYSGASHTLLVMPFENASKVPGIEWIGEAFPQVISERLGAPLVVISRDDRVYAFDHFGIPANLKPSRATLYRIAEQMDADYLVLGRYNFDGQVFTAFAQVLDMHKLRLGPEIVESGTLPNLMDAANAVAWQVLRSLHPQDLPARAAFVGAASPVRLDAFENYIRGVIASTRPEKIRRLREALRINPQYDLANFQLGRTCFEAHDYQNALAYLSKVSRTTPEADQASFYAGLAAYYSADLARAEDAFAFLSVRLPLPEVDNNLGVVQGRRGKASAVQYLQKAVQADPNDADYRYNLAATLYRNGNTTDAARQLREAIALRPSDADAKSLLEAINNGVTYAATTQAARSLSERIKRNYDETSFRQLALEIENATEMRLAQADPATHARAHVESGHDLLSRGLAAEAEKQFREAVQLDPANAAAHAGWAAALEQTGDYTNSRVQAGAALRLERSVEAYVTLARLDMRDGNLPAASTDVQNALALQPTDAAALVLQREIVNRTSTATASAQKQ